MFASIIAGLREFSARTPHIESLLLVGSYARGAHRPDSDLDVVIITPKKAELLAHPDFVRDFGEVLRQQTEDYGACTSLRVWYREGQEVEFGLVEPSWIARPLDPGTRRVLRDGYRVLCDRAGHFENLEL